jgi:predicted RNA-binding Zn-ribbon protein involved in translation (DUF1610 family)
LTISKQIEVAYKEIDGALHICLEWDYNGEHKKVTVVYNGEEVMMVNSSDGKIQKCDTIGVCPKCGEALIVDNKGLHVNYCPRCGFIQP